MRIRFIIAALLTLLADQAIKFFALIKIPLAGIFLINRPGLAVKLALTQNSGLAFGIHAPPLITIAAIVITLGVIIYLAVVTLRRHDPTLAIVIAIIFGAALSNFSDRIWRGGVIDFFFVSLYNFTWPSFNAADALITIAAVLLITNWPPHQSPAVAGSGTGQAR